MRIKLSIVIFVLMANYYRGKAKGINEKIWYKSPAKDWFFPLPFINTCKAYLIGR